MLTTNWLRGFRRITTKSTLLPEIDGLRLLALLLVFEGHMGPLMSTAALVLPPWLDSFHVGIKGVELFFTISAFILGLPFARRALAPSAEKPSPFQTEYKLYLLRRITRLEPPYILVLSLRALIAVVVLHQSFRLLWPHLLATLFYVHTQTYGVVSTISPPMWSLEVEVQFYLLAPLLASIFRMRSATVRRAVLLALVLLPGYFGDRSYLLYSVRFYASLAGNIGSFAAGFLLCDLYVLHDLRKVPEWVANAVAPLSLLAIFWLPGDAQMCAMPLLTLLLYAAVLRGGAGKRLFSNLWISTLGGMCYSIYLLEGLSLSTMDTLFQHAHVSRLGALHPKAALLILYPLGPLLAILVGAVFFRFVERPFMRRDWLQGLAQKLFPRRGAVAS